MRLALGPQRGLRAASLPPSARPPGKDRPKAPKGRKARGARAGRCLPARARHEGSVTQAAGSGETRVNGPGKQCPVRRTQQEPNHLGAHSAPGLPPGQPWSRRATREPGARAGFPAHPRSLAASRPQCGSSRASPGPRARRRSARDIRAEKAWRPGPGALSLRFPAAAQAPSVTARTPPPPTPAPPAQTLRWPCPVPPAALGQASALLPPPRARRASPSRRRRKETEHRPPRPITGHRSRSRTVAALPTSAQADMQRQGRGVGGDSKLETAVPRLLRRDNGGHPRALSAGHPRAPVTATRSPDAALAEKADPRPGARDARRPPPGWAGRGGWESRRRR